MFDHAFLVAENFGILLNFDCIGVEKCDVLADGDFGSVSGRDMIDLLAGGCGKPLSHP